MTLLLFLCIIFALLNWIAVALANRRMEYIAKPATLILLIVWFVSRLPSDMPVIGLWFLSGLAFSLAGDIFLLFPDKHFLKGLIVFLIAHIGYVIAFNLTGPVLTLTSLFIALVVIFIAVMILRRLVTSLRTTNRTSMIAPVVIYAMVLSLTLWSTTCTLLRPEWPRLAGWLVTVGGALFFSSDAAIAWNRFVGPHRGGRIFEMITYHLAQFSLSAGVLMAITSAI
ncbi:MAG TPA: lysoplasmalogenase [Anaerolineae bacterium]|nr:lysoplasmalogenase [Anaerolineae bacterium]